MLFREAGEAHFLAVFEELARGEENQVIHVRLQHEVLLEGQERSFLINKAAKAEVEQKMEALGKVLNCDRIYVFIFDHDDDVFDNILEWCADGVTPHIDDLQRIRMSIYPWWMKKMAKRQWVIIENTNLLPRSANKEREILLAQQIGSVLAAPLTLGDKVMGFVGCDQNHTARLWHEQEKKELETFKEAIEEVLERTLKPVGP